MLYTVRTIEYNWSCTIADRKLKSCVQEINKFLIIAEKPTPLIIYVSV
jgi:hypothetical protein